jgi:protein involved in polysaccharide export with SLBB domain
VLKYQYVGPIDEIQTIADGRVYTLKRGDTIEVSPYAAEAFNKQPSNWKPVKADKTKETS